MRVLIMFVASSLIVLSAGTLLADGDARNSKAPSTGDSAADRERAALAFVRENHPELAQLLEQLKPMKPTDYSRAIREIFAVSKTLTNLKDRDPKRYEVGLEVWKARSRVELLTAKLINAPNPEIESKLREAVAKQFDAEVRQLKLEREQTETKLKKLNANIERLESNESKLIENRFQALRKQSERTRRQEKGRTAPKTPAAAKKGESKA